MTEPNNNLIQCLDSNSVVTLIYICHTEKVICCCFQTFKVTSPSLRDIIIKHFKNKHLPTPNINLKLFLANCRQVKTTHIISKILIPNNYLSLFNITQLPTGIKTKELKYCNACGQCSERKTCAHDDIFQLKCNALVGAFGKNISPIPLNIIQVNFISNTFTSLMIPPPPPPLETLAQFYLPQQQNLLQPNQQQDEFNFNLIMEKPMLLSPLTELISNHQDFKKGRYLSHSDYLLKSLDLIELSMDDLQARIEIFKQPENEFEKNLLAKGFNLLTTGNSCINKLLDVDKSKLYSWLGDSDLNSHSGFIEAVMDSTLKKYNNESLRKLLLLQFRTNIQFHNSILLATEGSNEEKVNNLILQCILQFVFLQHGQTDLHIKHLYSQIAITFLASKNLIVEDEEDYEEDDCEDEIDEANIYLPVTLKSFTTCNSIASAFRFLFVCFLAIFFSQQKTFTFSNFLKNLTPTLVPNQVNILINKIKKSFQTIQNEKNAITTKTNQLHRDFSFQNQTLTSDTYYSSYNKILELIDNLFVGYLTLFNKNLWNNLLFADLEENEWKLNVINNIPGYQGSGYALLEALFLQLANLDFEKHLAFAKNLRAHCLCLILLHSSAAIRTQNLYRLHINPFNNNKGCLSVTQLALFKPFSTLLVQTLSIKQGAKVNIYSMLNVRQSKLLAIPLMLIPKITAKIQFQKLSTKITPNRKEMVEYSIKDLIYKGLYNVDKPNEEIMNKLLSNSVSNSELLKLYDTIKIHEFILSITSIICTCLNLEKITLPQTRKLICCINEGCLNDLSISYMNGNLMFDLNPVAARHLNFCVSLKQKESLTGFGDGAAHTSQTFAENYESGSQGAKIGITLGNQAEVILISKSILAKERCGIVQLVHQSLATREKLFNDLDLVKHNIESALPNQGKLTIVQNEYIHCFNEKKNVIQRTGCSSGKTFINILLGNCCETGFTVLIVPTRSLLKSVEEECTILQVNCLIYESSNNLLTNLHETMDQSVRIVVVVVDTSVKHNFLNFLIEMSKNKRINRIVIDEIHLLLEEIDFRQSFIELKSLTLVDQSIPFTLMSATLNKKMIIDLIKFFSFLDFKLILDKFSFRSWNKINFSKVSNQQEIVKFLFMNLTGSRTIVFLPTKLMCDQIYDEMIQLDIDSCVIYSDSPNQNLVYDKLFNPNCPNILVIATSFIANGINIPNIDRVFCIGRYNALQITQAFGRCGRKTSQETAVYYIEYGFPHENNNNVILTNSGFIHDHQNILNSFYFNNQSCCALQIEKYFLNDQELPQNDCNKCSVCELKNQQVQANLSKFTLPLYEQIRLAFKNDESILDCFNKINMKLCEFEQCILCQTKLSEPNFNCFPNKCQVIIANKSIGAKSCAFCGGDHFNTDISRLILRGEFNNKLLLSCAVICNDSSTCSFCSINGCKNSRSINKGNQSNCKTWVTLRNVLLYLWYSKQNELQEFFPEIKSLKSFTIFFNWNYKEKFNDGNTLQYNYVKVLAFFWMIEKRE